MPCRTAIPVSRSGLQGTSLNTGTRTPMGEAFLSTHRDILHFCFLLSFIVGIPSRNEAHNGSLSVQSSQRSEKVKPNQGKRLPGFSSHVTDRQTELQQELAVWLQGPSSSRRQIQGVLCTRLCSSVPTVPR